MINKQRCAADDRMNFKANPSMSGNTSRGHFLVRENDARGPRAMLQVVKGCNICFVEKLFHNGSMRKSIEYPGICWLRVEGRRFPRSPGSCMYSRSMYFRGAAVSK